MSAIDSRLCVIGLCAALVAGCGGGATMGGGNSGGNGNNPAVVTLTFPSSVTLVAAQIGTGAFTMQALSTNKLSFSIPSGTSNYAIAYICPAQGTFQGQFTEEAVWEASVADGTSVNLACMYNSVSTAGVGTLTGSLNAGAIPGVTALSVAAQGGNSLMIYGGSGGSAASLDIPAPIGSDRVLVLALGSATQDPLAARNFNNQTVPGALNGGTTVVFGAADETASAAIAYNNVPSGFGSPSTYAGFQMAGSTFVVPLAAQATTQYPVLPATAMDSGDLYSLQAAASSTGNGSSSVFAGAASLGGQVSLTFPAPWTYSGPMAAAVPVFNFGYTGFSGKTGILDEASYSWQSGTSGSTALIDGIELTATTNYQGASTSLTAPNLSSLTGFLSAPASGGQVNWSAGIWQFSYGVEGAPTLSSTWAGVSNSGVFTTP